MSPFCHTTQPVDASSRNLKFKCRVKKKIKEVKCDGMNILLENKRKKAYFCRQRPIREQTVSRAKL